MMERTTIENEEQNPRAADPLFSDDAVFTDNALADLAQHHDLYLYAEQAS